MKSWKTTLLGILSVLPAVLHLLFPSSVTSEVATGATTVLVGLGLANAKDNNVTGGTVQQ